MGLLDQAFSLGGSLVTGWLNNQYAEDRQNAAQDFSAKQYATRYQTQVADMKAAGLNPMLAYTQAPGNAPGGIVGSSNATPDLGASINQSRQAGASESQAESAKTLTSAQAANINADTANKVKQGDLLEAQAAAQWASAYQSHAQVNLINATVDKTVQEVSNLKSSQEQIIAVVANLHAEREKLIKEGRNLDDVQKQIKATTYKLMAELPVLRSETARNMAAAMASTAQAGKAGAETSLLHLDKEARDRLNNIGGTAAAAKPIFDILSTVLRAR